MRVIDLSHLDKIREKEDTRLFDENKEMNYKICRACECKDGQIVKQWYELFDYNETTLKAECKDINEVNIEYVKARKEGKKWKIKKN